MGDQNNHQNEDRRVGDSFTAVLLDRMESIERVAASSNADTLSRLDEHISSCASQQRWLLRAVIGLCGWVVLHSPEAMTVAGKLAAAVKP